MTRSSRLLGTRRNDMYVLTASNLAKHDKTQSS